MKTIEMASWGPDTPVKGGIEEDIFNEVIEVLKEAQEQSTNFVSNMVSTFLLTEKSI